MDAGQRKCGPPADDPLVAEVAVILLRGREVARLADVCGQGKHLAAVQVQGAAGTI